MRVAYATGPAPSVTAGIDELREVGAKHVTLAPWFVAHGLITDRIAAIASAQNITMAEPLGAHRLVAATVLDRFDRAVSGRVAA